MLKFFQSLKCKAKKRKGVTLIEMLMVVALIIVLAVLIAPNLADSQKSSRIAQVNNDLRVISVAAVSYSALAKDASIPTAVTEAAFTLSSDKSVDGQEHKFLKKNLTDPWGGSYTINATNRTVTFAGSEKEKVTTITREF